MPHLYAPNGLPIEGTLEVLQALACINDESIRRLNPPGANGIYEFDYTGDTKVYWDGQETTERDGERIFIDEAGNEWKESQLTLQPTS